MDAIGSSRSTKRVRMSPAICEQNAPRAPVRVHAADPLGHLVDHLAFDHLLGQRGDGPVLGDTGEHREQRSTRPRVSPGGEQSPQDALGQGRWPEPSPSPPCCATRTRRRNSGKLDQTIDVIMKHGFNQDLN